MCFLHCTASDQAPFSLERQKSQKVDCCCNQGDILWMPSDSDTRKDKECMSLLRFYLSNYTRRLLSRSVSKFFKIWCKQSPIWAVIEKGNLYKCLCPVSLKVIQNSNSIPSECFQQELDVRNQMLDEALCGKSGKSSILNLVRKAQNLAFCFIYTLLWCSHIWLSHTTIPLPLLFSPQMDSSTCTIATSYPK